MRGVVYGGPVLRGDGHRAVIGRTFDWRVEAEQAGTDIDAHSIWRYKLLRHLGALDAVPCLSDRVSEQWTAPAVDRAEPDRVSGERVSLEQWLDYQRATLLMKCAGLTADQLKRRAVSPSRLSLLGLVRHMTEVERWWFRMHAAQEDHVMPYDPDAVGLDFEDIEGADAAANLDAYRAECEHARAAVAGLALDAVVPSRGDHPDRVRDLRWIFVHMIEEYARHNGHADLLRERIDGATGD